MRSGQKRVGTHLELESDKFVRSSSTPRSMRRGGRTSPGPEPAARVTRVGG